MVAARLLLAAGANVNEAADDGSTPLVAASIRAHVPLAEFLLNQGADPKTNRAGYTALHWAAGSWEGSMTGFATERDEDWHGIGGLRGHEKLNMVKALLAHGANPNAQIVKSPPRFGPGRAAYDALNLVGATPFLLAAYSGDAVVMRALVAAGADPRLTTKDGTTPLMAASGYRWIIEYVLLTKRDPLDMEAARFALELGGDVNAMNVVGDTALHGAAHIRSDTLVRFLVDQGARIDAKNRAGETPLMIAERRLVFMGKPVIERTSTGDLLRKLSGQ